MTATLLAVKQVRALVLAAEEDQTLCKLLKEVCSTMTPITAVRSRAVPLAGTGGR